MKTKPKNLTVEFWNKFSEIYSKNNNIEDSLMHIQKTSSSLDVKKIAENLWKKVTIAKKPFHIAVSELEILGHISAKVVEFGGKTGNLARVLLPFSKSLACKVPQS